MPLEIIDYLPINDNLLVIVNSLDLAIFGEASHSCGLAAPEDRHFEGIPFWNKIFFSPLVLLPSPPPRIVCVFPPQLLSVM